MRAVEIIDPGENGHLRLSEIPKPELRAGEVLIRVAYAGVNRADIFQRQGRYPAPAHASPLPGLEVAGEIAAVGPECTRYRVGDKVCALLAGGGYAEYALAREALTLPVPEPLSLAQAAALPEALFTAWMALVEKGNLRQGERVLIHGGASGVGSMAIRLAKLLGATVFATAGTPEKCVVCEALGAEQAINYREEDFGAALKDQVDVVLDMVGGTYFRKNLSVLRMGGRLICIAFLQGAGAEVNFAPVLFKELAITGFTLRSQPLERKEGLARSIEGMLWEPLARGRIVPLIDREFPLEEAGEAHLYMENNLNIGKIVLRI